MIVIVATDLPTTAVICLELFLIGACQLEPPRINSSWHDFRDARFWMAISSQPWFPPVTRLETRSVHIHIDINLFEITPAKLTTLRNLTNIDRRMVTHDSPGRLLLPRAWQPWNLPSSRWSACYKRCQREKPFDNFLGVAAVHCGRNSARLKCLLLGWWI